MEWCNNYNQPGSTLHLSIVLQNIQEAHQIDLMRKFWPPGKKFAGSCQNNLISVTTPCICSGTTLPMLRKQRAGLQHGTNVPDLQQNQHLQV